MSRNTSQSLLSLHGVNRSDRIATYAEVAALVCLVRQELIGRGMPARPGSAVGALFAKADRLDREWILGKPSDDIELLMQADDAFRIAVAILEAIEQPNSWEAIRRITKSDMRL